MMKASFHKRGASRLGAGRAGEGGCQLWGRGCVRLWGGGGGRAEGDCAGWGGCCGGVTAGCCRSDNGYGDGWRRGSGRSSGDRHPLSFTPFPPFPPWPCRNTWRPRHRPRSRRRTPPRPPSLLRRNIDVYVKGHLLRLHRLCMIHRTPCPILLHTPRRRRPRHPRMVLWVFHFEGKGEGGGIKLPTVAFPEGEGW